MEKVEALSVFIAQKETTCSDCGTALGHDAWIRLVENKTLCLDCADLGHLEFLPSGNVALTRRTQKYSGLYAVVLKWNRRRKRYDRQGILAEAAARDKAEQECLDDAGLRALRNERQAVRRTEQDLQYIQDFSLHIRHYFRNCPEGREREIAQHACAKYSGRVGRTAFAKELDEKAITLAVIAHIRHIETPYDTLLMQGLDRYEARERIAPIVEKLLRKWRGQA